MNINYVYWTERQDNMRLCNLLCLSYKSQPISHFSDCKILLMYYFELYYKMNM